MPPIPKFAKALAKLAKANPKVIPGETPPKIKKMNTSEKTIEKQIETKKFAKDDMEIDKIRREKAKKELEQRIPQKAKDDSDLATLATELKSIKTDDLKGNVSKIFDYIQEFKKFLSLAKINLKETDPAVSLFNELSSALDKIDATKVESIPTSIRKIASKIHKEAKKGVNKHGKMV